MALQQLRQLAVEVASVMAPGLAESLQLPWSPCTCPKGPLLRSTRTAGELGGWERDACRWQVVAGSCFVDLCNVAVAKVVLAAVMSVHTLFTRSKNE
jgi:hypothetical protein